MLIPFQKLCLKYKLNIKGILHVGAHLLEEQRDYENQNIKNIIWVEGNPKIFEVIKNKVNGIDQKVFNYLISDKNDEDVNFHIANNGQSSSILEFGLHQENYPSIVFIDSLPMKTKTLKNIFLEHNINAANYNFINLDIQGVELKALKGFGDLINNVDYIYTEVNDRDVYKNNDLIGDIDNYLEQFGFKRIETIILKDKGWGDAFYSKKPIPSLLYRTYTNLKFLKDTSGKSYVYRVLRRLKRALNIKN